MKTCFKCGVEKPLDDFYKHPMMRDGRLGKCKECNKADVAANYKNRRGQYALYEQQRFQKPERRAAAYASAKRMKSLSPEKYKAHHAVSNAVRDGRLLKQPCEVCGSEKAQAHHDDYSKPLDVRWLCRVHHMEVHGKVAYETLPGYEART